MLAQLVYMVLNVTSNPFLGEAGSFIKECKIRLPKIIFSLMDLTKMTLGMECLLVVLLELLAIIHCVILIC